MRESPYEVPDMRKVRVIIDTDAKAEADDQFAIVHALMTPKLLVRGIVAAHFRNRVSGENAFDDSMERSYREIHKLVELMGLDHPPEILRGCVDSLTDERTALPSEGSDFIIREALREDSHPLYVAVQGTLTNVAGALLKNPAIAERMTVIWIGGAPYSTGGGHEFNLTVDVHAANVVFASQVPLWQVPANAYSRMKVGFSELFLKVAHCGAIGRYLYDQMVELNRQRLDLPNWPRGESWSLGDSPLVALLMDPHETCYDVAEAPRVDTGTLRYMRDTGYRPIRVYNYVDARFLLEDLFAKLKIYYG